MGTQRNFSKRKGVNKSTYDHFINIVYIFPSIDPQHMYIYLRIRIINLLLQRKYSKQQSLKFSL